MDLIRRRRSYWHFRSEPVPGVYIEGIVDAARYAPSGFNSQLWEFVAVTDGALQSRIVEILAESAPPPPPRQDRSGGRRAKARARSKTPWGSGRLRCSSWCWAIPG